MSLRPLFPLLALPVVFSCAQSPPATLPATSPSHQARWTDVTQFGGMAPNPSPQKMAEWIGVLNSKTGSTQQKVEACQALELAGPAATPAVGALIGALGQGNLVRFHAERTLFAIGPAAIPALRAETCADRPGTEDAAANVWAKIEVDAGVSMEVLKQRLARGSTIERLEAVIAVREFDAQTEAMAGYIDSEGVAKIVNALRHGTPTQQIEVLHRFETWGAPYSSLAPIVRPLMESPSAEVADAASDALCAMRHWALPQVLDAMKSPDARARALAAGDLAAASLVTIDSGANATVVKALGEALDDKSPEVVTAAAHSLSSWGLAAHPLLVKAIKDGNEIAKAEVIHQLLTRPEGFTENFPRRLHPDSAPAPDWGSPVTKAIVSLSPDGSTEKAKRPAVGDE